MYKKLRIRVYRVVEATLWLYLMTSLVASLQHKEQFSPGLPLRSHTNRPYSVTVTLLQGPITKDSDCCLYSLSTYYLETRL